MILDITSSFTFTLDQPTDNLLQFEAAALSDQKVISANTRVSDPLQFNRVPAQDEVGERIWVRAEGSVRVDYQARVEVTRKTPDLRGFRLLKPHELPGHVVEYVFDSRYCQADRMQNFVADRFGKYAGGDKIVAMRDWIAQNITYEAGASNASTSAFDTFGERRGICRDFAHVMITFARASAIPARYTSCYAPGVTPQDFHAVAEVFVESEGDGGGWQIVDPTGMADPANTVKIGIGRDAADVSFMTTFGLAQFKNSKVEVRETA
ncbi:transglutaminase-like domain-containing protein [Aurantiacibacter sp. D1-12]|uniref:transglutaminase-like domain-containing protein n=1 Tax=Aurantiacibacter sp. D1-12 TaxID=2993658 RepID=UPI00237CF901|nr:transglutaminase family protein [Aurantiacibacter sp. D1-12]MDE1467117.1 transglutaminase family protein [Aurantiacibacter sp. D1-12]